MTEKELRKMRPQDIIQLLIVQGNEAAQLQSEIDMKDRRLNLLKSSNEVLKAKLNDRDALTEFLKIRLDISDVRIRETEKKMAEARSEKWIEIEEAGSIVKAAKELETILKAAQKEANEYLGIEEEEEPELKTEIQDCRACWCDACAKIEDCQQHRDGAKPDGIRPFPCIGCLNGMRFKPREEAPCEEYEEAAGYNNG